MRKKYMKKLEYIFYGLEFIGALVVLCVWAALIREFSIMSELWMNGLLIYALLTFATITMVITLYRERFKSNQILPIMGIALLLLGAYIPYFDSEYLFWAINLPIEFWFRVSIYSIPAICTEGAAFTLFLAAYKKFPKSFSRKTLLLSIGFIIYAVSTIVMNFLAINYVIPVESHVLFSHVSISWVIIITIAYIFLEKNIQDKTD